MAFDLTGLGAQDALAQIAKMAYGSGRNGGVAGELLASAAPRPARSTRARQTSSPSDGKCSRLDLFFVYCENTNKED